MLPDVLCIIHHKLKEWSSVPMAVGIVFPKCQVLIEA